MDFAAMWKQSRFGDLGNKGEKKGWFPIRSGESSFDDGSDDSEKPCLGKQTDSENQSESSLENELPMPVFQRPNPWKRLSFIILLLSVISVTTVALWPTSRKIRNDILDCGNSPAEAAAKGCTFDILESAWVHPECFDAELQEKYNPLGVWDFFYDEDLTRPMSDERVASGVDELIYTFSGFHQAHCLYIFDKMERAIMTRRPVNTRMLRESHVEHCALQMLVLMHEFNETSTTVGRNYLPCDWTYL